MSSPADRQPAAQIKIPRLQLVWSPASVAQAKWYLGLAGLAFREMPRRLHIYLSIRGALRWGIGTTLAIFFVGTAVLAFVWGRNPYNHITYADLVLPTHWPELRHKRGQGLIDEGIHELRARDYSGFLLLNHGVALCPTDMRGRMALAEAYISMGYLHRGLQLLEDGLVFGPPPKLYRESLFKLSGYLEDYEKVLELADRMEKQLPPGDKSTARWLLAQRIVALEKLQRYDEIEHLRGTQADSPSFALEAAWARVQAVRGRPAEALREIARDPGRFGVPADRCQLQLTLAVAAHDSAAASAAVAAWLKEEPTQPQPRIQEIITLIQLGEPRGAHERLRDFFLHFGSEKAAVILLLKKFGELRDAEWLQTAQREASEAGAMSIEAHILYVQGLLAAGKASEAVTEFSLTAALIARSKAQDGGWSEGTRLLLNVISSDSPSDRSQFLEFFRSKRLTPEAFRFALRSLRTAEARDIAAELAILARNRFPAFQDDALLPTPSATVTRKAGESPAIVLRTESEARMELRRLDADLADRNYPAAFTRLKTIESAGFDALKPELLMRRIRVQGALREQGELTAALQLYLSAPNASQAWLSQLAQQWSAEQRTDSALILARETYARFPQARWAAELLNLPEKDATAAAAKIPAAVRNEVEARVELRHIDEELAAGNFPVALERIKAVERAKISSVQPEVLLRRIQLHGSLREQTELTAALGYYLSGQNVNQTALRALASQWDNERQRDSALSLLRETLAKFPQARWALELRKKIEGDLLVAPGENLTEPKKR